MGYLWRSSRARDDEPAAVGRVSDEADDCFVGPERPAAPVDRDERKQSVLDLVPLAGARRQVADVDRDVDLVGDALKLLLPHVRSTTVAAACVGDDEDVAGVGAALRTLVIPEDRKPARRTKELREVPHAPRLVAVGVEEFLAAARGANMDYRRIGERNVC